MRIAFAGTPEFAATALRALHDAGHSIVAVLTQPDRPAGRGQRVQPSAVKRDALARGLPVLQPPTLRGTRPDGSVRAEGLAAQQQVLALFNGNPSAELLVVAAYGLILPAAIVHAPRRGCLNIHASLLPRWRGAAPIHRAIEAGDATTGICIMRMEEGLDTGPVLLAHSIPISPEDTTGALHDRLAELGARCIVDALDRLDALEPRAQPEVGVTYAHKIEKYEAALDFSDPAPVVARRIRAFNPFPVARARLTTRQGVDEIVRLWNAREADPAPQAAPSGTVIASDAEGIVVACATGAVRIVELQRAGGARLRVDRFLAGFPIAAGDRFAQDRSSGQ